MNNLLILIIEFFKTGLFAVGGGLATIPFLYEMAIKYGFFSVDLLATMIAVSESTPGPIGVNMATYVGFEVYGITGGILATLALVTPSVIIITIIASMLDKFNKLVIIKKIFYGLRPAAVGLILAACTSIFISTLLNLDLYTSTKVITDLFRPINIVIFIVMSFIYKKFKLNPILIIGLCGILGILLKL